MVSLLHLPQCLAPVIFYRSRILIKNPYFLMFSLVNNFTELLLYIKQRLIPVDQHLFPGPLCFKEKVNANWNQQVLDDYLVHFIHQNIPKILFGLGSPHAAVSLSGWSTVTIVVWMQMSPTGLDKLTPGSQLVELFGGLVRRCSHAREAHPWRWALRGSGLTLFLAHFLFPACSWGCNFLVACSCCSSRT